MAEDQSGHGFVVPTPSSVPEVEQVSIKCQKLNGVAMLTGVELIKRLYQPGHPQHLYKIQEALHRLQRSPEGWQLADALLRSDDEKVRFFGALTFTVKLNSDW